MVRPVRSTVACLAAIVLACAAPVPTPIPPSAAPSSSLLTPSTAVVVTPTPDDTDASIGPAPDDRTVALETAGRFQVARARRDFDTAWGLLSAEMQAVYGRRAVFVNDSLAYLAGGAAAFTLEAVPADRDEVASLLREGDVPLPILDLDRAFLVRVHHPGIPDGLSAEYEVFVVAPDGDGRWRLWRVG